MSRRLLLAARLASAGLLAACSECFDGSSPPRLRPASPLLWAVGHRRQWSATQSLSAQSNWRGSGGAHILLALDCCRPKWGPKCGSLARFLCLHGRTLPVQQSNCRALLSRLGSTRAPLQSQLALAGHSNQRLSAQHFIARLVPLVRIHFFPHPRSPIAGQTLSAQLERASARQTDTRKIWPTDRMRSHSARMQEGARQGPQGAPDEWPPPPPRMRSKEMEKEEEEEQGAG